MRLSRTCNLRDSLWCNHSAAVLCTLCLLLGGYSTQRPTSLHQCPPSPILLAVEARSVVRLPGSSNTQPDMLLSSHAEEAHPSSVEYCWRTLPFLANISNLTTFTSLPVLVLPHRSTTNLSIVSIAASTSPSCGFFISDANCPVVYGYMFQVSHAVRLPLPEKQESVSHPVNAWNIGSARHLSSPIAAHILWAGISL